jgi:hypothetical protein
MKKYFAELDYKLEYMEEIREKTVMREKLNTKLNKLVEGKNEDI